MRQSILAALGCGVALGLCGCGGRDRAAEVANAEPVATVEVGDLIKAYSDDFGTADEKYKGKVIVVEGLVARVSDDPESVTVALESKPGDDDKRGATSVQCDFPTAADKPKTKKGQRIKIKGRCSGKMGPVIALEYCVLAD